jgi:hypothetical protein
VAKYLADKRKVLKVFLRLPLCANENVQHDLENDLKRQMLNSSHVVQDSNRYC